MRRLVMSRATEVIEMLETKVVDEKVEEKTDEKTDEKVEEDK